MKTLLFLEAIKPGEILLLLAIAFGIVFLFRRATRKKYGDTITLKNGSVIHGKITEQNPNASVTIETKDKNVFVYKNEDIEKIIINK
jgi:hypothetical protein